MNETENIVAKLATKNISEEESGAEGNVLLAMIGAGLAALFGAVAWAVLVEVVAYRAAYLLPGIGYLVGKVIHKVKGDANGLRYGMMGAFFSFGGCFLANLIYVLTTNYNPTIEEMIPGNTRRQELSFVAHAMLDRLRPSDILLYAAAIYLGFVMSYKDKEEEIILPEKK